METNEDKQDQNTADQEAICGCAEHTHTSGCSCDAPCAEQQPEEPRKRKKRRKPLLSITIFAVVAIIGIAGFNVAHEQPQFCNLICHQPMDPYVEGYVSNDPSLLAAAHEGVEVSCLNCHNSSIGEQLKEGLAWATGNYELPLEQREFGSEFCSNDTCHNVSSQTLAEATADREFNPHSNYHGENLDCGSCHKAHEESVYTCASCHSDAEIPSGWTSA